MLTNALPDKLGSVVGDAVPEPRLENEEDRLEESMEKVSVLVKAVTSDALLETFVRELEKVELLALAWGVVTEDAWDRGLLVVAGAPRTTVVEPNIRPVLLVVAGFPIMEDVESSGIAVGPADIELKTRLLVLEPGDAPGGGLPSPPDDVPLAGSVPPLVVVGVICSLPDVTGVVFIPNVASGRLDELGPKAWLVVRLPLSPSVWPAVLLRLSPFWTVV